MYNHVLIDADIAINKICFSSQTIYYQVHLIDQNQTIDIFKSKKEAEDVASKIEEPVVVIKHVDTLPLPVMKGMMDKLVMSILDTLNCHTYTMYIGPVSGTKTYRHDLAVTAPYKGNRKAEDKPQYIEEMQQYLIDKYNASRADYGETDDMLGIDQCSSNDTSVIVTIDKDLLMIPGWHYNPDKQKLHYVTDPGTIYLEQTKSGKQLKGTGFKWFLCQLLMGDNIDNIIKPQKGLGDVKIYNYLTNDGKDAIIDIWNKVNKIYDEAGRDIHENCQLLWVLREKDKSYMDVLEELTNDK